MPKRPGFLRRNLGKLAFLLIAMAVAAFAISERLKPKSVVVTPVQRGTAMSAVYATGTVEADDRVIVKAKSSGTIAEIYVREGTVVKKGDLLARIDNPLASFDLKRGETELAAAKKQATAAPQLAALANQGKALEAELDVARKSFGRLTELHQAGAIPKAELDTAEARVRQLEAQIAANKAQQYALSIDLSANADRQKVVVESQRAKVEDTFVRSPLDGVVLTQDIDVGSLVTVSQPLFKVGDTSRLVLEVYVDEADIARIHDGREAPASIAAVSLYAYPDQVFRGKVVEILPDAIRDRKAFLTKVQLDEPPVGLRSGMSAEVNVVSKTVENALLAPALAETEGYVWLVRGGQVHKQAVKVGMRDLLRIQILDGLEEGDLVVVEGPKDLKDGDKVITTTRLMSAKDPVPDLTQPEKTSIK